MLLIIDDSLELMIQWENFSTPKCYYIVTLSFQRFLLQLVSPAPVLDNLPAFLNVVETNPFKHLTHLSLKLLPGNDVEIKKFLAGCLKCSKVRYKFKLFF